MVLECDDETGAPPPVAADHLGAPGYCRSGDAPEERMTLRLVSSGDGRALAIRDHLVPLVRGRGRLEVQRGAVRLATLETGPWAVAHWTPFNELAPDEASSPGYRHALERQQAGPVLPYGIEVQHNGIKVLSVLWADDGASEIVGYVRGPWEDDALRLR
jgi:hypothetical protein